jgi:glycine cleavage system H protein
MQPHEIISLYSTKPLEYIVAILYLLLFVGFWRFVNGEGSLSSMWARAWTGPLVDLFRVPAHLFFHRGHRWARLEGAATMTIGLDDCAQQLVRPVAAIALPPLGTTLKADSHEWPIEAAATRVEMPAPVRGTVVPIDDAIGATPAWATTTPPATVGWQG